MSKSKTSTRSSSSFNLPETRMATLKQFEQAIDTLLSHSLGVGRFARIYRFSGKIYEAYVFGLCLHAVRDLGASPILTGIKDRTGPFIFRGAPGQIYSETKNFGYARFELNGEIFEIHCSIEYRGRSKMNHELDVSIIRGFDAEKCRDRRSPATPGTKSLVGAWECKFRAGKLPKMEGRAFVGLMADMGTSFRLNAFCSNTKNVQLGRYFSPKGRPYPHFDLTPDNPETEKNFVEQVKTELVKLAPPK